MITRAFYTRGLVLALVASCLTHANDEQMLQTLLSQVKAAKQYLPQLNAIADHTAAPDDLPLPKRSYKLALYEAYPTLEHTMPSVQLCDLPTPVRRLDKLSAELGAEVYDKQDGLTNNVMGGNKMRKDEFQCAKALKQGADAMIFPGCVGSNYVAAGVYAAEQLGLRSYAVLKHQPNSQAVRKNLLFDMEHGASIHFYPSSEARDQGIIKIFIEHKRLYGKFPYFTPIGGSNADGAAGYVEAAFELRKQIRQGELPEPDYIYVSTGSKGTAAGLALGLKAAGLKSVLVPVCVEPEDKASYAQAICDLSKKTNEKLHAADPSFALYDIKPEDLPIIYDCCGDDYGVFSPEGMAAKKLLQEKEGVTLDGTYTAKGFSGLVRDARSGKLKGKKVLFWNTYCAHAVVKDTDYTKLPKEVHSYFETDVQPLDK